MRHIVCNACTPATLKPMHPEDVAMGFHRRVVRIDRAARPEGLATRQTVHYPDGHQDITIREIPSLLCDRCGAVIKDGEPVTAVTMWRDVEPPEWESQYTQ